MTDTMQQQRDVTAPVGVPLDEVVAAARELAKGGRWQRAARLLDATTATGATAGARLALAAAEVAVEADWFGRTGSSADRLRTAEEAGATADLAPGDRWDLTFLRLRHDYFELVFSDAGFHPGPDGKGPETIADLEHRADDLAQRAPDGVRRGWAHMYRGLIADNLAGERDAAPAHYEIALAAGEPGDDLLAREALRHLGDHDHDNGDHQRALDRWCRATTLGARAGAVVGTLSQQMLLAVLARDAGDEAGATALAREIARWAEALGAVHIQRQATAFLAGTDPTAPPQSDS